MLKIVVSKPEPFANTDFSKYREEIGEAINTGHSVWLMQYLHGCVADQMGYDIGACLNAEICMEYPFELQRYKEGVYDAEVVDYPNPCKAFLWNSDLFGPRGLIVDATNEQDVKYAKICFNKKVNNL